MGGTPFKNDRVASIYCTGYQPFTFHGLRPAGNSGKVLPANHRQGITGSKVDRRRVGFEGEAIWLHLQWYLPLRQSDDL